MEVSYHNLHKDIIERCKLGDRQAQHQLYHLYAKAMYNICLRMMASEAEAQDLLQDAFIEAFRRLESFRHNSTFGAWLKRIVVNKCINALKKKSIPLSFQEQLPDELPEDTNDAKMNYQVEAIKKEITVLPDGYRIILSLYLLEGYDHKEIAQILDISESTSKTQYHRAKKKLKEKLRNYA